MIVILTSFISDKTFRFQCPPWTPYPQNNGSQCISLALWSVFKLLQPLSPNLAANFSPYPSKTFNQEKKKKVIDGHNCFSKLVAMHVWKQFLHIWNGIQYFQRDFLQITSLINKLYAILRYNTLLLYIYKYCCSVFEIIQTHVIEIYQPEHTCTHVHTYTYVKVCF